MYGRTPRAFPLLYKIKVLIATVFVTANNSRCVLLFVTYEKVRGNCTCFESEQTEKQIIRVSCSADVVAWSKLTYAFLDCKNLVSISLMDNSTVNCHYN